MRILKKNIIKIIMEMTNSMINILYLKKSKVVFTRIACDQFI